MERNPGTERWADADTGMFVRVGETLSRCVQWIVLALCVVVAPGVRMLAADDDAVEWSLKAPLVERSLLLDVVSAGDALVAVGERGHVIVSNDGGTTWSQSEVPTRSTLTGVFFHDRKLGWAVGHDAVILRTTDGGINWKRVHWAPEDETPFLDVWFADAENGIAIGAYGACFVTEDGGETWAQEMVGEEDFHLNQIARSDDGRLYIAAEAGNAFRSDDGGGSWTSLSPPYEGSFFGVLPLEGETVLLFGLRGHLFRSEDAGETWAAVETGTTAMLNSGIRLADGRIVIVGLGGVVLVSNDGGRTFALVQQSSRAGIQALVDAGGGKLELVGEFGVRTLPVSAISGGESE